MSYYLKFDTIIRGKTEALDQTNRQAKCFARTREWLFSQRRDCREDRILVPTPKTVERTYSTYPQKANLELPYSHVDFSKRFDHYLSALPQCLCAVMLDIFSSSRIKEKPSPKSRHWPSTFCWSLAPAVASATSGMRVQNKTSPLPQDKPTGFHQNCITIILNFEIIPTDRTMQHMLFTN